MLKGSTTAGNPTFSEAVGKWWAIGNIVIAYFKIRISNLGGMSGEVVISGIPFPIVASIGGAFVNLSLVTFRQTNSFLAPWPFASYNAIRIMESGSGVGSDSLYATGLSNTSYLEGYAIYTKQ